MKNRIFFTPPGAPDANHPRAAETTSPNTKLGVAIHNPHPKEFANMIKQVVDATEWAKRLVAPVAITLSALCMLLLAPLASAQGPMMPPTGMPGMGMPPMGIPGMGIPMGRGMHPYARMNPMAALNLTQEQLKTMQDTAKTAQAASLDLMKRIGDEAIMLRSMLVEATPDAEKIGATYQKIFDLQRQAIENAVTTYNKQLSVLDPDQLKKWNAIREQMLARLLPAGTISQSK